jgi:probable rRNA maturation factor
MPLSIDMSNRQRRLSPDMPRLNEMAQQLGQGVFAELKRNPPKWLKRATLAHLEKTATLSVVLVSNQKIRQLNREWRGKDYATDVLSFPLAVSEDGEVSVMPQEETLELGELVISLEKALEQASAYGHSFEREFAFLFVHGVLHVLGFDHITKEQERDMFGRQGKILDAAGFQR